MKRDKYQEKVRRSRNATQYNSRMSQEIYFEENTKERGKRMPGRRYLNNSPRANHPYKHPTRHKNLEIQKYR